VDELANDGIESEFGGNTNRALEAEVMVVSPGVPTNAPVILRARAQGLPVVSEVEVASWFTRAEIIAVTGTNGKTTTTALIGRMLSDARIPSMVGGNIGVAFSGIVDELKPESKAVLEISSFQLDTIASFRPRVSVLLNITPDHLDRYDHQFEKYAAAKSRIFENQSVGDTLIYNRDDEMVTRAVNGKAPAGIRLLPFSVNQTVSAGAWVEGEEMTVSIGTERHRVIPTKEISIRGRHNLYNAMAATLAAYSAGASIASLRATLKNFKGVEHRLEFVREFQGVLYVNDSKATNVDSVRYALQSFEKPLVVLMGGRDKGNHYDILLPLLKDRVKGIVAIGESADRVEESFERLVPVRRAETMREAVRTATSMAGAGDVVLLSPACASFDWFENYEHRGRVFKEEVMKLGNEN
jgi:UDP-N-acetylmuramoylalanine--D-glutamate ligase